LGRWAPILEPVPPATIIAYFVIRSTIYRKDKDYEETRTWLPDGSLRLALKILSPEKVYEKR